MTGFSSNGGFSVTFHDQSSATDIVAALVAAAPRIH
jgi:hypothetical protein